MLPTESLGWIGFHALKVRLAGRLAVFTRRKTNVDRPTKLQNDADLLDCDLRDVFNTAILDVDLSNEDFNDLDQRSQDLLITLNAMVNKDIIPCIEASLHRGSHDITKLCDAYPNLAALVVFLDESEYKKLNLVSDPDSSLFILPDGEIRDQAISHITAWKAVLQRLAARSDISRNWHGISQMPAGVSKPSPMFEMGGGPCGFGPPDSCDIRGCAPPMPQNPVGLIMDALFEEFQQANCGALHQIKLRVEEHYTSSYLPELEMIMSCCQTGCDWQEVGLVCDSMQYEALFNSEKKDSICIAIYKAWKQRIKLRLLVDDWQLFDVTHKGPPIPTSLHDYKEDALRSLLDKNMFRPISPGAYLNGLAIERFDHREKTALALSLAKCLMVFFDKSLKHAACNWNSDSIFFIRSSHSNAENPRWHILVTPHSSDVNLPDIRAKIGPGNPVLLSFAKLLLEIINGEKIDLDVDPWNANKNIGNWAKICGYVEEARQDGNSFYLQAVQGCLYLHMHAQQTTVSQISPDFSGVSTKEVIYEQIVQNLEKELNPDGLKRKRQNSFSESPQSKKPYAMDLSKKGGYRIEHTTRQNSKHIATTSPSHRRTNYLQAPQTLRGDITSFLKYDSSEGLSQNTSSRVNMTTNAPQERADFDVAIICAIATEYNAVCQVFDEFWDEEGDRYGRAAGDLNTYTTGRIGKHNVVLALLPRIGKSSAAAAAASFRSSYSSVELALLVGICGGVPRVGGYVEDEILLGDVVISKAVVQYDFGRRYPDKFARKDTFEDNLSKAAKNIQSLLKNFETDRGLNLLQNQTAQFLLQLQNAGSGRKHRAFTKYRYPGTVNDRLFRSDYRHKHRGISRCGVCESESGTVCEDALNATCEELGCEESYFVERERLQEKEELKQDSYELTQAPAIHLGAVASGDTVLKSGEDRDEIARKEGVIAFEMEGAGIWEEIPCIVVKGVCDYADSHKNKKWQDFAAATAAAAAKALLQRYPKTEKARYW